MVYGSRPMNSELEKLVEVAARAVYERQREIKWCDLGPWETLHPPTKQRFLDDSETSARAILSLVLTPTQTEYGDAFYGASVERWCSTRLREIMGGPSDE